MPTGTNLTDGEVRSIFALRAEGEQIPAIAKTMSTGVSVISRVLARKTYSKVSISQNVLDAIAGHSFRTYKKKRKVRKVKDTRPPAATLDDLNLDPIDGTNGGGVIQQAAKEATTDVGSPEHPHTCKCFNCEAQRLEMRTPPKAKPYTTVLDEAHRRITKHGLSCRRITKPQPTKAAALVDVLACVERGNALRQQADRLRHDAHAMEAEAKKVEDSTFVKLTALHELGFSQEFLNSLLTESGMCTDGRFTIK